MKTFEIYGSNPDDNPADDEDDIEKFVSFDIEDLRALRLITRKKCGGPAIAAIDEAVSEDALSWDHVTIIRALEIEFAREIAEFKARRRPLRQKVTLAPGDTEFA